MKRFERGEAERPLNAGSSGSELLLRFAQPACEASDSASLNPFSPAKNKYELARTKGPKGLLFATVLRILRIRSTVANTQYSPLSEAKLGSFAPRGCEAPVLRSRSDRASAKPKVPEGNSPPKAEYSEGIAELRSAGLLRKPSFYEEKRSFSAKASLSPRA